LLFTRLLAWWFFCDFIHSFICFFIPWTSACCLWRPCKAWGPGPGI
jgi:hypothetical protein